MTFRSGHQLFLVQASNKRLAGGFSRRYFTAINPSQSRSPRKPTEPVATQWNVSTYDAQGPSLSSPASDPVGQSNVPLIKWLFSEVCTAPTAVHCCWNATSGRAWRTYCLNNVKVSYVQHLTRAASVQQCWQWLVACLLDGRSWDERFFVFHYWKSKSLWLMMMKLFLNTFLYFWKSRNWWSKMSWSNAPALIICKNGYQKLAISVDKWGTYEDNITGRQCIDLALKQPAESVWSCLKFNKAAKLQNTSANYLLIITNTKSRTFWDVDSCTLCRSLPVHQCVLSLAARPISKQPSPDTSRSSTEGPHWKAQQHFCTNRDTKARIISYVPVPFTK